MPYTDGSEVELELPEEDPGEDTDGDRVIQTVTAEEIEEGTRQGLAIDVDDDDDHGLPPDTFRVLVEEVEDYLRTAAVPLTTQTLAQQRAAQLKTIAQKWGVTTSIELLPGRGTDPWGVYTKYMRMWHHTVSTYRVGGSLTPVLHICKVGRTDVTGPLCNGYIGYDRIFRIICMGEANHPGLGGPVTIDGVRIPENSARKPTFGIEVEGGIQTWEEIDRLGPDMLQTMGRIDCALAEWSERPLTSQMDHCFWAPDRKVDRKGFCGDNRARAIALTRKWFDLANPNKPPIVANTAAELLLLGGL